MEHRRRYSVPLSSFVEIREENEVSFSQDRYLSLIENKINFINFLSTHFFRMGVKVVNCSADADNKIASIALNCAKQKSGRTLVVADDTDIAVLLLYH